MQRELDRENPKEKKGALEYFDIQFLPSIFVCTKISLFSRLLRLSLPDSPVLDISMEMS